MDLLLFSSVASVGRKRAQIKESTAVCGARVISVTCKGNEPCLYQLLALLKTREVGQRHPLSAAVTKGNCRCA